MKLEDIKVKSFVTSTKLEGGVAQTEAWSCDPIYCQSTHNQCVPDIEDILKQYQSK